MSDSGSLQADYSPQQHLQLWRAALAAICHGLQFDTRMPIDQEQAPAALLVHRACFVTLKAGGALRGCIGSLEAREPLITNVANNAFNAAFRDPRFSPLCRQELSGLSIQISILNPSQAMDVVDEQDLLNQLRPGVDGLILRDSAAGAQATFLPSVWEELSKPQEFVHHLKLKAGLTTQYWSSTITFARYTVESFRKTVQPDDIN